MATLADLIRDSSLAQRIYAARYGREDPEVLAIRNAKALGFPQPGSSADEGEAKRYESSRLAAERFGPLPLFTNPIHELLLSWFAEGEGSPSLKRLLAGYRGAGDALEKGSK